MRIGVDFDNTIVQYDSLFHQLAVDRLGVPQDTAVNKTAVRDWLRAHGREDEWTELQGVAYGPEILGADAFPGVKDCFRGWVEAGHSVFIVSHKTRTPYRGEPYDLHEAALRWLTGNGFLTIEPLGLPRDQIFLELTKAAKLARIDALGCDWFIDDLPELLSESSFPSRPNRLLFGSDAQGPWQNAKSWAEISAIVR